MDGQFEGYFYNKLLTEGVSSVSQRHIITPPPFSYIISIMMYFYITNPKKIYLSVYSSIIHLSPYPSIVCLPINLIYPPSICPSVYPPVYLSVSVYISI